VTIELARRLLRGEVIGREQVEDALADCVRRRVAFVQALLDRDATLAPALERELARCEAVSIHTVRPVSELYAALPDGLCAALLAVPVRRDPREGTVDVAAVDPFDRHVASEFGFHLDAPIRVLRAPLEEVQRALDALRMSRTVSLRPMRKESRLPTARLELVPDLTPVLGTPRRPPSSTPPPPAVGASPSSPPLPLVKRSLAPRHREPTDPGLGTAQELGLVAPDEPVIALARPKTVNTATSAAAAVSAVVSSAVSPLDIDAAIDRVMSAGSPAAVVDAIASSAGPGFGQIVVYALRGNAYEARSASTSTARDALEMLTMSSEEPSILKSATDAGYYLGSLPTTLPHAALRSLISPAEGDELYAVPVTVSGRTALVVLIYGFGFAFATTQAADRLARAASETLERIVVSRKHR
jgi:hypothetical protein